MDSCIGVASDFPCDSTRRQEVAPGENADDATLLADQDAAHLFLTHELNGIRDRLGRLHKPRRAGK